MQAGQTPVLVGLDGRLIGLLGLSDMPREGAAEAIARLRDIGIRRIVMLTGDQRGAAEAIARDLLIAAGKGKTHIVLPRSARWLWTIKRLMPSFFLNTLLPTAARLR